MSAIKNSWNSQSMEFSRELQPTSKYRPDIDGLRAIAVVAVVIFHAFPDFLPGGFTGVDVFFVISGYLISAILGSEIDAGRFSVLNFYARRIRRIFPALLLMLILVLSVGWCGMLTDHYQQLGKHVGAGAAFFVNALLYIDTEEYFGAISSPLIHLWSLGVEEQFYLIWPLLMWGAERLGRWRLVAMCAVLAVSFVGGLFSTSEDQLAAFYLPWNRVWELAIGGVLAAVQARFGVKLAMPQRLATSVGMFGAILIVAGFFILSQSQSFPGWRALLPVGGAVLVIASGPTAVFNQMILANRTMVYIGLISYPLYLWHWPLLSLVHEFAWREFNVVTKWIAIAVAFGLSVLTYRCLEWPIRHSQKHGLVIGLIAAMAVIGCWGMAVANGWIPARSEPPAVAALVAAAEEPSPYPKEKGFVTLGAVGPHTLYLGDSTMAQYHGRIQRRIEQDPAVKRGAVFAWRPGCAPIAALSLINAEDCEALLQQAIATFDQEEVKAVVIGFCWYAYFTGIIDADRVGLPAPLVPATQAAVARVEAMIEAAVKNGKTVYLVLQTPLDPGFAPQQMIARTWSTPGFAVDARPVLKTEMQARFAPFNDLLRQAAERHGAIVIDPINDLCDAHTCTPLDVTGAAIYHDSFHLRSEYIQEHLGYLDHTLL